MSAVYAEDNEEYECIQLPIVSDQLKETVKDITLYKKDDILYIPLNIVCSLINAEWYIKDDGFYVSRDNCMYFRYYNDGNMKLIVDLGVGDDKWNKSNNVLLEGSMFSCKKIGVEWCVDFIKFCDMFGVNFRQVSKSTIQSAKDNIKKNVTDSAIEKLKNLDIEKDLDFKNNPYYIYLYSGTPLISLYAQVMGNENLYLWDYSCYENLNLNENEDNWLKKILNNIQYSDVTQKLIIQSQNYFSNIINDNWGITKIIESPFYESSEHYKKSLIDISSVNYSKCLKSEDLESLNASNKAQDLERILNSNTIISSSDSTIAILNNYLNEQIKIPELESFNKISDIINCIGTPFQTWFEVEAFHNKLNNINETKVQLLKKSIIDNKYIDEKANVQGVANEILNKIVKTPSTNILLNSVNNYTGLRDSANELCSLYKNSNEQFKDKLNKSIESGAYALSDTAISKILSESGNPYLVLTGAVIGVYDGFTAWTKENFGEQLQKSENLVQSYFLENLMKNSLDIKNPENLYNRLTLMLQSSLYCFEYDEKYFESNRNSISKMLYKLDNDKNINIDYYHDPRNNNVNENIKNAILNFSDNKIEPTSNYEWHLAPTIEAGDIIVPDNKEAFLKTGYVSPYDECAIIHKNEKYGIIKYDGSYIAEPIYEFGGYDILWAMGVYNEYDQTKGSERVDVFSDKGKLKIQINQEHGWGYVGSTYYWDNDKQQIYQFEGSPVYGEHTNNLSFNVVVQSADINENGDVSNVSEKYGIANQNKLLVPIEYDKGYMHSFNNIIVLEKNGKWTYFDKNGNIIINNCEKQNNFVIDWWHGFFDWLDLNNDENNKVPYLPTEGYIPVKIDSKCGYYDIKGNEVIPCGTFEEVRPVHNGLAWVKKNGKWGVIKLKDIETEPDTGNNNSYVNIKDYEGAYYPTNSEYNVYLEISNVVENSADVYIGITNNRGTRVSENIYNTGNITNNTITFETQDGFGKNQFTLEFEDNKIYLTGKCIEIDDISIWAIPELTRLEMQSSNKKEPLFTGMVNTEKNPLNVRKSPSTEAEIIGRLDKGSTVTVYSEADGWCEIEYNGGIGYVSKEYIKINGDTENQQTNSISDNEILKAVNKYLEENQGYLGTWLTDSDDPYCPAEYMYSNDTNWSCPINLSWEKYSAHEIAGAYPHFAYVDKCTLKCTLTANYETVVEFDLSDYIQ